VPILGHAFSSQLCHGVVRDPETAVAHRLQIYSRAARFKPVDRRGCKLSARRARMGIAPGDQGVKSSPGPAGGAPDFQLRESGPSHGGECDSRLPARARRRLGGLHLAESRSESVPASKFTLTKEGPVCSKGATSRAMEAATQAGSKHQPLRALSVDSDSERRARDAHCPLRLAGPWIARLPAGILSSDSERNARAAASFLKAPRPQARATGRPP
jgi:hypothetical protein